MPIDLQQDILHRLNGTVTSVAPLREGAVSATANNGENGVGFIGNSLSGLVGCRIPFALTDFSARDYLTFQLASNAFDSMRRLDTVANGGLRFLIEDANGNWSRWNIHGNEINTDPNALGVFKAFAGTIGASNIPDGSPVWYIDKNSTPDAVNGTVDYSSIVAVEVTANMLQTGQFAMYLGLLGVASRPVATGGNSSNPITFFDFWAGYSFADTLGGNGFRTPRMFLRPSAMMGGANTAQTTCQHGFEIGNGSTSTYFQDSNFELAFYPTQRTILSAPLKGFGVGVIDTALPQRDAIINLAAGSTCQWNTFSITGPLGDYRLLNVGSTAEWNNGRVFGAYEVQATNVAGNVTFTSCNTVSVDESTNFTSGAILDQPATGKGLYIVGGPAAYSGLNIVCGDKITIKADTGGTYDLRSLTLPPALTVTNESAVNDITVLLREGSTVSTATSGGGINIPQPPKTLTISGLIDGCSISIFDNDDNDDQDLGTLLASDENLSGDVFTYDHNGTPNNVIIQMIADGFQEEWLEFSIDATNQNLTLRPTIEENI